MIIYIIINNMIDGLLDIIYDYIIYYDITS